MNQKKTVDQSLLDILACPACKGNVELVEEEIICQGCGKRYPIKNGVPVMLVEEAK